MFSRIAIRLIIRNAWLTPKTADATTAQGTESSWRKSAYESPIVSSPASACRSRMWSSVTPPKRFPSFPQTTNRATGWPKYSLSPNMSGFAMAAYFLAKNMIATSSELTCTGSEATRIR